MMDRALEVEISEFLSAIKYEYDLKKAAEALAKAESIIAALKAERATLFVRISELESELNRKGN